MREFESRVLSRMFGPRTEEITAEWRKLHIDELSDQYSLSKIVSVIKLRRMRWAGHVTRMGERSGSCRVLVEGTSGKEPTWKTQA